MKKKLEKTIENEKELKEAKEQVKQLGEKVNNLQKINLSKNYNSNMVKIIKGGSRVITKQSSQNAENLFNKYYETLDT